MPTRRITLITNPAAGRGAGERTDALVRTQLARHNDIEALHYRTEAPGHAMALAREALDRGTDLILACGGDGTVNEVATALIGVEAALGIVPVGTGNDLARCIGIPLDPGSAVATALLGKSIVIDVGKWECSGREGAFVNVAGAGFDALVAQRINDGFRMLRGTSAYFAAVCQTLVTFRPAKLDLCVDGRSTPTSMMLCAIANATCYGGGMQIAPNAEIDDGLLDVVLIEGVGRLEFLSAFPRVFDGTHVSHPKVHVTRGKDVSIGTSPPVPVLADGEVIGTTPARFTILPKSLRIVAPRQEDV